MDEIDLIVPTIPGREESLERCLESFGDRVNPIVVRGASSCGEGWIEGLRRSGGDYVLLCADDIEAHPDLCLVECKITADEGYLPAPIVYRPNGSIESAGGDMSAPACLLSRVEADWTPVDFTPMPFLSREQIRKIRMIPAHYMTDVYASYRGRDLGYETVLRTPYRLIHHHLAVGRIHGGSAKDRAIFDEALAEARAND